MKKVIMKRFKKLVHEGKAYEQSDGVIELDDEIANHLVENKIAFSEAMWNDMELERKKAIELELKKKEALASPKPIGMASKKPFGAKTDK